DGATANVVVAAINDTLIEGGEVFLVQALSATGPATASGTRTISVTDNDSATLTLSGSTTPAEGGGTGSLTATPMWNTSGSGAPSLATPITTIKLASNGDYSSDTQSFSSGALNGDTVTLMITATNDQLVEGLESFTASLAAPSSNASVNLAGSGAVDVTDN